MSEDKLDFLDSIYYYTNYETKDWQKILELGNCDDLNEKRRLSWVWPTIEDLQKLQTVLKTLKIRTILSIGCGCGLLEWILRESIGIKTFGLEIDSQWWQSQHAIKSFIKKSYIDDLKPTCLPETFMQRCCDIHDRKNWKFGIMFCYFNNHAAFLSYLDMYKGQWIIITGPNSDAGIHTDPSPLEPNFPPETHWELFEQLPFGINNMVAIYRNQQFVEQNEQKT